LQESAPVHWSEQAQSWFVTRHEDVVACFRDPRRSAYRPRLLVEHQLRGIGAEVIKDHLEMTEFQMLNNDGADHARRRRNANPGFTVQAMDGWRPAIRQAADSLLDRVQQQGRMDLVQALPLSERI
jgi:cytochrome P450 PksS